MKEKQLHKQICRFIKLQYPKVIFLSDMSGLKVSIGTAIQMKALRSSRGLPDLLLLKPNKDFYGLFIEIKTKTSDVYLKDGKTLRNNEHVKEQSEMLDRLSKLGYKAVYGIGYDNCINIIKEYLNDKN
tara:strand:+ start:3280 stop:3663 length:384 start_codon:yes stop_codon:yes gene_type:complete